MDFILGILRLVAPSVGVWSQPVIRFYPIWLLLIFTHKHAFMVNGLKCLHAP